MRKKNPRIIKNIGVTGTGPGCGSTTVAAALAYYHGKHNQSVCFTEIANPAEKGTLFFDSVDMERRFGGRKFLSFYQMAVEGERLINQVNMEGAVNWRIITRDDVDRSLAIDDEKIGVLISSAKGDICIFDIDSSGKGDQYLTNMDLVITVTDPLPSRLIRDKDRIETLMKLDIEKESMIWVINRMNEGVTRRQMRRFFPGAQLLSLPFFDAEEVYTAEYRCEYLWNFPKANVEFNRLFREISEKTARRPL